MIPRNLHIIWVGDESKRPEACIQTWRNHHPDWNFRLWGNEDLASRNWLNAAHMKEMAGREWNGVADMMRWEILFDEGGVLVDADSLCLRPLPEWLLNCESFACWENELVRPGLVAAGYFGTVPRNPFLAQLIQGILEKPTVVDRMAWETVGPLHLTETWRRVNYTNLTLCPSHFFIPRHFTGVEYKGGGPVYARQAWGSTLHSYEGLAASGSLGAGGMRPQAFLLAPDWKDAEWVEVLLSYLEAFGAEDPVILVLSVDPEASGVAGAEVEAAVLDIIARTGRDRFPQIAVLDRPGDLLDMIRTYPLVTWVPRGRGNAQGFRGGAGLQFAKARLRMAMGYRASM